MAKKEKIKKNRMLYQLVDQSDNPVKIDATYYGGWLSVSKSGKMYHSVGAITSNIKRSIDRIKAIKYNDLYNLHNKLNIKINDVVVTKDELITAILALKIQHFEIVPTTTTDLTFYLDKIV